MRWILLFIVFPIVSQAQFSKRIDAENFKPLEVELILEPDYNFNNLRFDIIRDQEEVDDTDSTTSTENVDYNNMGFDLGTFLFWDLNNNLSLRIDKLMGIEQHDDFTITSEFKPFNRRGTFQYENGKYSRSNIFSNKLLEHYNLKISNDTIRQYYKRRLLQKLIKNENGLFLNVGKRTVNGFYKRDNNYYTSKNPKWGHKYYLNEDGIYIDRNYLITTNQQKDVIEIRHHISKSKSFLLYSIQYNDHEIIIYNKFNRGYHIIYSPSSVEIYAKGKKRIIYTRTK